MVELTDDIRREIGQHFVVGFHGYDVSPDIELLIKDYYVGNIILMKRNVQSAKQVHALVQKLQQIAKNAGHERPLMIGTDQENGLVSAFSVAHSNEAGTQFPGAMALAAVGSPDVAERITEASARELKLVGINWAYSPVGDVNSDPRNPVIGVRSFGDVPEEVSEYVTVVCRGLTKAGVAPSVKHFPGHGDTHIDSHVALPIISKDATSLAQSDLIPFRAASDAGVATIMVGHMALPAITGGDTVPASLSRAVIGDLLRESLGYGGVVVTDCLEMEAVAAREGGVPVAAVDALRAGADIAMICHRLDRQRGALEAAYDAIQSGALGRKELNARGQRGAALKDASRRRGTALMEASRRRGAALMEASSQRETALMEVTSQHRMALMEASSQREMALMEVTSQREMALKEVTSQREMALMEVTSQREMALMEVTSQREMALMEVTSQRGAALMNASRQRGAAIVDTNRQRGAAVMDASRLRGVALMDASGLRGAALKDASGQRGAALEDASRQRIAALKDAFAGSWEQVLGQEFDEAGWARLKAEHVALSRQTYVASIALVRNPNAIVPLSKSGSAVVLTPRMESLNLAVDDATDGASHSSTDDRQRLLRNKTAGPSYMAFAESVSKRVNGASVHIVYSPEEPLGAELEDAIEHATSVLFVTRNADRSTWQLDRLREVLRLRKESRRVVVLASCAPYDLLAAPADIEGLRDVGYVASFEFTVGALEAAVAVIFGEEVAKGKVPVCEGNVVSC